MTTTLDKAIYKAYNAIMDSLSPETFDGLPDYAKRAVEDAEKSKIDYEEDIYQLFNQQPL